MEIFGKAPRALVLTGHRNGMVSSIVTTRDGKTALTHGNDGQVIAWDTRTRSIRWARSWTDSHDLRLGSIDCLLLDDDHAMLADNDHLRIIRLGDGQIAKEHNVGNCTPVAVLSGRRLVCSIGGPERSEIVIFDPWSLQESARFSTGEESPGLTSQDGSLILAVPHWPIWPTQQRGTIAAWQLSGALSGTHAWTSRQDDWIDACFITDKRIAALGSSSVSLLDASTGMVIAIWPVEDWLRAERCAEHLVMKNGQLWLIKDSIMCCSIDMDDGRQGPWQPVHLNDDAFDIWHRDHMELRPPDSRARWHGNYRLSRTGMRTDPVGICAANDGIVAIASSDGTITRWNVSSPRLIARDRVVPLEPLPADWLKRVAVEWRRTVCSDGDRTGRHVVVADERGIVQRMDIVTGSITARIETGITHIGTLAINHRADMCVVAGGQPYDRERTLCAFSLTSGACLWTRCCETAGRWCFDADDDLLYVVCADVVMVLRSHTGRRAGAAMRPSLISKRTGQRVYSKDLHGPMDVSNDGRHLVVGGMGWPWLWAKDRSSAACSIGTARDGVSALAFSTSGDLLAAGECSCPLITVHDVRTGVECRLVGHMDRVCALTFTPDGLRLVSAGADGMVMVWSTADWRQLLQATLLPTAKGAPQQWCIRTEDGSMNGSPGFERFLNPHR